MFIAKEIRKTSIAEYILYMWQLEDLIRAYDCSLSRISDEYISKFNYTDEQKAAENEWFGNLIRMMNEEGKREKGHLNINKVLPFIVELRNKGDKDVDEIETCLNVLYGIMMLRMQKKEISADTERAVKEITTFIGMLSDYYIKNRDEGLDFGNEE